MPVYLNNGVLNKNVEELVGNHNVVYGNIARLIGNHNIVYGIVHRVVGNHNTIHNHVRDLTGNHNKLMSGLTKGIGNHNLIEGPGNIQGNHNRVYGGEPTQEAEITREPNFFFSNYSDSPRPVRTSTPRPPQLPPPKPPLEPPPIKTLKVGDLLDRPDVATTDPNKQCSICLVNEKRLIMLPCKHQCVCKGCWQNWQGEKKCPLCREEIIQVLDFFE